MQRKKTILNASTLLFGVALGGLLFFGLQRWAGQIVSIVTTPFLYTQHVAISTIERIKKNRAERAYMTQLIAELEAKNQLLLEQATQYAAQSAVNTSFEQLLSFAQRYNLTNAIPAQILLKNLTNEHQYMLVGCGANKYVHKNDIALAFHQLVGKVVEVYPFYSKVQLITDPKSRIAVECASTHTRGIAAGTGSCKKLTLSFAVHFSQIKDQDIVLSLGTGLIFPRGFGIGTVIKQVANDVFHAAYITPLINLEQLDQCLIIDRGTLENITLSTQGRKTIDTKQQKSHVEENSLRKPLTIPQPPMAVPLEAHSQTAAPPAAKKMATENQAHQTPSKTVATQTSLSQNAPTKNDASDVMLRHDTDLLPSEQHTTESVQSTEPTEQQLYD
ncbi:TPA: hypothetical protein DCW54_02350 [Candidatus Dependentiae bacterium]|nr:hypothetical protein [Candidatus Dependentiae bacterium]